MGKYIVLFVNILIIFVISAIGGMLGLFWGTSWSNYFGVFFGMIAVQLCGGWMWTYFVDSKMNVALRDIQARNDLIESIRYVDVLCAYCSSKNKTELYFNKENYFTCSSCNENNHVTIAISTERTTKPVDKDTIIDIFRKLDKK
jgi:hypothetical protein